MRKKTDKNKGRPHFGPSQVRTLNGIPIGAIVKLRSGSYQELVCILSIPKARGDSIHIEVLYLRGMLKGCKWEKCLADYGILPYYEGHWNTENWIQRTNYKSLTGEEINDYIASFKVQ